MQGGDLFDAIATDIKYTEGVARDMIHDLADALQVSLLLLLPYSEYHCSYFPILICINFAHSYKPFCAAQYLHDRMICHRDIKPENLLVIDRQTTKVGALIER